MKYWFKKIGFIILLLILNESAGQSWSYPVSGNFVEMSYFGTAVIESSFYVVYNDEPTQLSIGKYGLATWEALDELTLDLGDLLNITSIRNLNVISIDDNIHVFGIVVVEGSTTLEVLSIHCNENFDLLTYSVEPLQESLESNFTEWRIIDLANGDFLCGAINISEFGFPIYLLRINIELDQVIEKTLVDECCAPLSHVGFVLEEVGTSIHCVRMSQGLVLDSSLEVQQSYNFNYSESDSGKEWWRTFIFNASTTKDGVLYIQGVGYLDQLSSEQHDNMIWVLNEAGDVIDTTYLDRPETDEMTIGHSLNKFDDKFILGSAYNNEFNENIDIGEGLFFSTMDEGLDPIWNFTYSQPETSYSIAEIETTNDWALAVAFEYSWLQGEFYHRMLFVKFALDDISTWIDSDLVVPPSVGPNPADGRITVHGKGLQELVILDYSGRILMATQLEGVSSAALDITTFDAGYYIVKVVSDSGASDHILIKE